MQIPRNGINLYTNFKVQMDQNVIIRFWWESVLSSASRNHLITFCRPFVHYAQGRTQGGGLGLNPHLELDILQKLCYLCKGD